MLISTGSKELHLYTRIKDYKERCFARVLSTQEAVAEAVRLGFEGKHLIAMQGPYSEELNLAMLKHINAKLFCDERIRRRRRVRGKEKRRRRKPGRNLS